MRSKTYRSLLLFSSSYVSVGSQSDGLAGESKTCSLPPEQQKTRRKIPFFRRVGDDFGGPGVLLVLEDDGGVLFLVVLVAVPCFGLLVARCSFF